MSTKPKDLPQGARVHFQSDDKKSGEETRAFSKEWYEEDRRKQDHKRSQGIKNASYWALLISVGFGMLVVFTIVVIWAIHSFAPGYWRWLEPDEVQYIKTVLFSGALSASITMLAQKLSEQPRSV